MKVKFAFTVFLLCSALAAAQTTYYFCPSTPNNDSCPTTPNSTIINDLNLGSMNGNPPNTYVFAAGTYSQATAMDNWIFPCINGNIFTGPVVPFTPGTGVSPTAIFQFTYPVTNAVQILGAGTYTTPGSGCTIQFLAADGQNFVAYAPISGLLWQFNAVYNIVGSIDGSGDNTSFAGIYFSWTGPGISTTQDIGYSLIQWNTFGPSGSNVNNLVDDMADGGACSTCSGIVIKGSNVNVTVANNNTNGQATEFFHTLHQSSPGNSNGEISTNLLITNNDCSEVHRECIELQQENVTNLVVEYNDFHDPYNSQEFTFGISNACCTSSGGSTAPGTVTTDNLIVDNLSSCSLSYCMGYAIEAWGYNPQYTYNLIQGNFIGNAIALGSYGSAVSNSPTAINNTMEGYKNSIVCENGDALPNCSDITGTIVYTPNVSSSTISASVSTRPTVSPASGTYSSPQLITVNESSLNTSIYCTTDGSSPVPDLGSTFLYTGPFSLTISGTTKVKCVGMWGAGANPYSYPSGYGYVPSTQTINTYTASSSTGACDNVRSSFGTNCYSAVQTLTGNKMHSNYVTIGSQPVIPSSCTFYIGTPGQVGYHVVCGIAAAPTTTTEAATPDCYGVYTESSATPSNSFVTVTLDNCPVENAGSHLWVFENSNDDLLTLGYSNCGSSCSGSATSGSYGSWYVSQTYNSYNGFSSSFNGQNTWQMTNFITASPALITLLDMPVDALRWRHDPWSTLPLERPRRMPSSRTDLDRGVGGVAFATGAPLERPADPRESEALLPVSLRKTSPDRIIGFAKLERQLKADEFVVLLDKFKRLGV